MPWIGAAILGGSSIVGGLLGSKGGGSQTQTTTPWGPLQQPLKNLYGSAQGLANQPRQYYPGQTYVGGLPSEQAAFGSLAGYNQSMFGSPTNYLNYSVPDYGQQYTPTNAGYGGNTLQTGSSDSWGELIQRFLGGGTGSTPNIQPTGQPTASTSTRFVTPWGPLQQNAQPTGQPTASLQGGQGGFGGSTTAKLNPYTETGQTQPSGQYSGTPFGNITNSLRGVIAGAGQTQPSGQPSSTPFGNVMGAMGSATTGQDTLGRMSSTLGGAATGGLLGAFGQGPQQLTSGGIGSLTPTFGQAGGIDARGTLQQMLSGQANWGGAGMVSGAGNAPLAGGQFNAGLQQQPDFRSAMGTAGMANAGMGQFGTAGNLNATGAIQQALSGQGDYGGLQQAITAANAPILRQFNEEIIPGLNSRATFLSNPTGGIKTLNRVMPEIGQRMSENAATLTEGERRRALDSQQNAMGLVSQGGLAQGSQASSQLYGAGQSALDRAAQQRQQASSQLYGAAGQMGAQNYGAYGNAFDQAMQDRSGAAGLVSQGGLSSYGLGLQGATTNANLAGQYRSDLLGLGGLAGGLAGDSAQNAARWGALFPGLAEAGRAPYEDMGAYAQYQRGLSEQQLGDSVNRYNYAQQEPYDRYSWMSGILQNNPYQSTTSSTGSSATGALGGAIAGGQLGSILASSFAPASTRGYNGINTANYPISVPNDMSWIMNMPIQQPRY